MVVALLVLATVAGLGLGALALGDRVRAEWTCEWRGRSIRLVARQNTHSLYVDGKQVAQKTTLTGAGTTLSWTIEARGSPVVLSATVVYMDGDRPVGRIFADGERIGGTDGEGFPPAVGVGAASPEPIDGRWSAARVLLADLRAARDSRHGEAAQRLEAGLRDVLGSLDRLVAAQEAHRALGGDHAGVATARARLEGQAGELLEALREFHLHALADSGAPSLDRINDLLAHVVADAELTADAELKGTPAGRVRRGAVERP